MGCHQEADAAATAGAFQPAPCPPAELLVAIHGDEVRRCDRILPVVGQTALWVVVVTALVSAADYFRRFNFFFVLRVPAEKSDPIVKLDRKAG